MKKIIILFLLLFPSFVFAKTETIELNKCIDGDTAKFVINNEVKTVRFLSIDTEESKSTTKDNTFMGKIAGYYTCFRLKTATKIEIEYDDNANNEDKYGRVLGWIFIDDELLQNILVEKGYAKVAYLYSDYKYTDRLIESESNAKELEIGVWNEENLIEKIYNFCQKLIKIFT